MKKFLFTLSCMLLIMATYGQTNVSGGIFSNTTWTLANSPYIITDTVVVFPGVTLTIDPGVVVKFDSAKFLEVREANIIAEGTASDSITFTSNAVSPSPGLWTLWLNNYPSNSVSRFNYCNFHYGTNGLYNYGHNDSLFVRNSNFQYNNIGLYPTGSFVLIDSCNFSNNTNYGIYKLNGTLNACTILNNQTGIYAYFGSIQNCRIESNQVGVFGGGISIINSTINHNQTGVSSAIGNLFVNNCIVDSNTLEGMNIGNQSTIMNSEIKYNSGAGIVTDGMQSVITRCAIENNIIGIKEEGANDTIQCNTICQNTSYNLYYLGSTNFDASNNFWCSTDSATIKNLIYDGYINLSVGLVYISPFDSIACQLINGISQIEWDISNFNIFPNPAKNNFTVSFGLKSGKIEILNMMGQKVYEEQLNAGSKTINTNLITGIYFVKISYGENFAVKKVLIEN